MDDLFVMGAWVSSVAVVAGVKLQFSSGIGWHAADIATLPNGTEILTKMVVVSLSGANLTHYLPITTYPPKGIGIITFMPRILYLILTYKTPFLFLF